MALPQGVRDGLAAKIGKTGAKVLCDRIDALEAVNVNLTAEELAVLDGVTAGAASASKALVVDADRLISNLGVMVTATGGAFDINGAGEFVFDADADTTMSSGADDEIDIEVNGAMDFKILANIFRALSGSSIQTNTINETTADAGVTVDGVLLKDAGVTGALTFTSVARTATADGTGTGTIAASGLIQFVAVTAGGDANSIIVLPAPTPGTIVILYVGATGYELRTSAPATVAINGGAEANAESAISANKLVVAICTSATTWHAFSITGTTLAAVEAAAAA